MPVLIRVCNKSGCPDLAAMGVCPKNVTFKGLGRIAVSAAELAEKQADLSPAA